MSPNKMGRPKSENPLSYSVRIRLDKETYEKLKKYSEKMEMSISDVVRMEIKKILDK